MKTKIYLITAILCYLAAIVFMIAAITGKNTIFIAVGALWMCIGTLELALSRKRNGNKR